MKDDPTPQDEEQVDVETSDKKDEEKPKKKSPRDIVQGDGTVRLSLGREEIPVELEDPDSGTTLTCVLRELAGAQRDKYLNNLGGRVRTNADGKVVGIKQFEGLQANLLVRCLFKVDPEDGSETAFKEPEIQKFPANVQTQLFNLAKDMSGLDQDAEDKAGKD